MHTLRRPAMIPHPNCYFLTPQFLAGEYPGAKSRAAARDKLSAILDAGVTAFFDLTEADELMPYEELLYELATEREAAVQYERFPICDLQTPERPQQMVAILDAIDEALAAGHTVYLHCWGGVGGTGTVVGCWLVRHGYSADIALAHLGAHLATMQKAYRVPRSPETDDQVTYVRTWKE